MSNMKDFKEARAKLLALVIECPMSDDFKTCLFYEKRELSLPHIFEWIHSLSDQELRDICLAHGTCLKAKVHSGGI